MAQPPVNRLIAGILVALIALHVLHVLRYNFVSDDAFISLRYAANLLAGHGLVFNPRRTRRGLYQPAVDRCFWPDLVPAVLTC